jgi:hypothetical protein
MIPRQLEYTKIPPETGGCCYFLIEKSPKATFKKNILNDIILINFVRNRSRIKNIFTSGHFEMYLFKVLIVI